jgi:hypothetical protein
MTVHAVKAAPFWLKIQSQIFKCNMLYSNSQVHIGTTTARWSELLRVRNDCGKNNLCPKRLGRIGVRKDLVAGTTRLPDRLGDRNDVGPE